MLNRREQLSALIKTRPNVRELLLKMPGARTVIYVPITESDINQARGQAAPIDEAGEDLIRMAFDHALIDEGLAPFARPLFPIERTHFELDVEAANCVIVDYNEPLDEVSRYLLEQMPAEFDPTQRQVLVIPPATCQRYPM